jgi:uncharacterized protein YlxW (UPF0749 family)
MNPILAAIITTACTVATSLLVTFIFNKLSGVPKKLKDEKMAREQKIKDLEKENSNLVTKVETFDTAIRELIATKIAELSLRLSAVEESTSHYPEYRAQSIAVQTELKEADNAIVELCKEIRDDVVTNRQMLDSRLSNLESREKNSLRAKILNEYRLYTDDRKNPMKAWTEMEHHSFFKLVEDYEALGGNDYVHKTILPAMNELDVIPMSQLEQIKDLYTSRNTQ